MPFPDIPTTPTLRSLYNGPSVPCGITDFMNARSKFINFAQVRVGLNFHKLQTEKLQAS